jgi:hypothetical protein
MKLDSKLLQYIENVVHTAQRVGIEDLIIEEGLIRAMDDNKTVVMHHSTNVPDLPFSSVGIGRINVFVSRLNIVKGQSDFEIDVTTHETEDYVKTMLMKAKGVKVDFRCANPKQIQAPKTVNDTLKCLVPLDADAVVLLQKAQSAMGSDSVTIISNEDGVTFELYDSANDKFSHTYKAKVESLEGDDVRFVHTYPLKIVLPLFKENVDGNFAIGKKGIMNIAMNGINLWVLPQVS